jgi:sugar phosphate isomerase/epimerase
MKQMSIGSWAYTIGPYQSHPVNWDTVTTKLAEYGFDGVELGGFAPHPNPDDVTTAVGRKAVAGELRAKGLALSGLAANLWNQKLANTNDHEQYIAAFTRNCDFARDLGIRVIRVDTVQPPEIYEEHSEEAVIGRIATVWKHCAEIAAERGLAMSWEFEPGFVLNKPREIELLLERIDAANFGVLYDTCHGQMVSVVGARQFGDKETLHGGQADLIKMLTGRINHIHLIDSDNTCHKDATGRDETSSHIPFGDGVIDFDRVLPLLNEHARLVGDWWTIDLCFWPDAWPVTKRCKEAVDHLNQRYG